MKPFVVFYESEGIHDYEGDFDTLEDAISHIRKADGEVQKEHDLYCNEKQWSFHIYAAKRTYSSKLEISRSFKSWEDRP